MSAESGDRYGTTIIDSKKAKRLDIERLLLPHFGILDAEKTAFYMENTGRIARETVDEIVALYKKGGTREEAVQYFKDKFYNDDVRKIYPPDAMELNTGIMASLIEREFVI